MLLSLKVMTFTNLTTFKKCPFVDDTFREGHVDTTRLLLNKGAEINTPSGSNDDTPLTLACWKGIRQYRIGLNLLEIVTGQPDTVKHRVRGICTINTP